MQRLDYSEDRITQDRNFISNMSFYNLYICSNVNAIWKIFGKRRNIFMYISVFFLMCILVWMLMSLERYLARGETFLCIFQYPFNVFLCIFYVFSIILSIISSCVLCHIFKLYFPLARRSFKCRKNAKELLSCAIRNFSFRILTLNNRWLKWKQ